MCKSAERKSQLFNTTVIDYDRDAVLIESVKTENRNNDLINLLEKCFANHNFSLSKEI